MRVPCWASLLLLFFPAALAAQTPPAAVAPALASLEGHWEGQIQLPQTALAIRCDFAKRADGGGFSGTIDIPQQKAAGLPLEGVAIEGATVRFAIGGVPGQPTFSGTLDGGRMAGQFTQNGGTYEFSLERKAAGPQQPVAAPPKRPQLPSPPFPYRELAVTFGHGEIELAGSLTLPPGDGPFPALMLFSGSGPQDRDSTILGHQPFLVLADRLTRAGFAVLRADDRGVGASKGNFSTATTADFIEDARAGIRLLAARPEIDARRLGMYGHSEGAPVAGGVAARGELDFVILAAGSGVDGSELIAEQGKRLMLAAGMPAEQVDQLTAQAKEAHRVVRETPPDPQAIERLTEIGLAQFRKLKGEAAITAEDRALLQQQVSQMVAPWFRYFLAYDPAPALEKIKVPVLVLQGELDLQVPADQNLPKIEAALARAGNRNVEIRRLPGLNHLLQPATKGLPSEYEKIETTLDESALTAILQFLGRFAAPAPPSGSAAAGG